MTTSPHKAHPFSGRDILSKLWDTSTMAIDKMAKVGAVDHTQPWEPQPGEPQTAYARFAEYRDLAYPDGLVGKMVPRPTFEAFAGALGIKGQGLRTHSSRYQWTARIAAYDTWVDRQRQAAAIDHLKIAQERHLAAVAELGEIAALERAKLLEQSRDASAAPLNAQTVVKMLETWIQLDRLILGEATARVEHQGKIDLDGWSVDDLRAQAELLRKNGALD